MRLSLTQSVHYVLLSLSLAAWASSSGDKKGQVNENEAKTTELKFRFKGNEIDGEALVGTDALVLFDDENHFRNNGHGISLREAEIIKQGSDITFMSQYVGQVVDLINPPVEFVGKLKEAVGTFAENMNQMALKKRKSLERKQRKLRKELSKKTVDQKESASVSHESTEKTIEQNRQGAPNETDSVNSQKGQELLQVPTQQPQILSNKGQHSLLAVGIVDDQNEGGDENEGKNEREKDNDSTLVISATATATLVKTGETLEKDQHVVEMENSSSEENADILSSSGSEAERLLREVSRLEDEIQSANERDDQVEVEKLNRDLRMAKRTLLKAGVKVGVENEDEEGKEKKKKEKKKEKAVKKVRFEEKHRGDRELQRQALEILAGNQAKTVQNESTEGHKGQSSDEDFEILLKPRENLSPKKKLQVFPNGNHLNVLYDASRDTELFKNNPIKALAGIQILRKRTSLLKEILESKPVSRTQMDFYIDTGIGERTLLKIFIDTEKSVMCQTSVSDYEILFENISKMTDSVISAPIAAMYRDKHVQDNLPKSGLKHINEDGTGYLAVPLAANSEILRELEATGKLMIWKGAAVFEAPEKGSFFPIPAVEGGKYASFTVVQKLDMGGVSQIQWARYRSDFGKYIAMYYEAVYMAAITSKCDYVLLTPVLMNATEEQYCYMIDVALRVHSRLSRYLEATSVTLSLPKELQLDLTEHLQKHTIDMAREDVQLFTGHYGSYRQLTVFEQAEPQNMDAVIGEDVERSEPLILEIEVKDTELNAYANEDIERLLLSYYFKSRFEDERRANLKPTTVKIGGTRLLNNQVLINSFTVEGASPKKI